MPRGHFRCRRRLSVEPIPISLNTFAFSSSDALGIIKRKGGMALRLMTLEVEFWNQYTYSPRREKETKGVREELHASPEISKPLTADII
jgi:hypothetical protein